ncbi:hypothetical protein DRN52_04430 [Thermococci archaeon]|nr:MAG: hypothetical protein DRN52_04430 [Thermococci archaeon]
MREVIYLLVLSVLLLLLSLSIWFAKIKEREVEILRRQVADLEDKCLSEKDLEILLIIKNSGDISLERLSSELGITHEDLSKSLERLRRVGLIDLDF